MFFKRCQWILRSATTCSLSYARVGVEIPGHVSVMRRTFIARKRVRPVGGIDLKWRRRPACSTDWRGFRMNSIAGRRALVWMDYSVGGPDRHRRREAVPPSQPFRPEPLILLPASGPKAGTWVSYQYRPSYLVVCSLMRPGRISLLHKQMR